MVILLLSLCTSIVQSLSKHPTKCVGPYALRSPMLNFCKHKWCYEDKLNGASCPKPRSVISGEHLKAFESFAMEVNIFSLTVSNTHRHPRAEQFDPQRLVGYVLPQNGKVPKGIALVFEGSGGDMKRNLFDKALSQYVNNHVKSRHPVHIKAQMQYNQHATSGNTVVQWNVLASSNQIHISRQPQGLWYKLKVIEDLSRRGYLVLFPDAGTCIKNCDFDKLDTWWQSNQHAYARDRMQIQTLNESKTSGPQLAKWSTSDDFAFLEVLFSHVLNGTLSGVPAFPAAPPLHVMGQSSGAFMASRLGWWYDGIDAGSCNVGVAGCGTATHSSVPPVKSVTIVSGSFYGTTGDFFHPNQHNPQQRRWEYWPSTIGEIPQSHPPTYFFQDWHDENVMCGGATSYHRLLKAKFEDYPTQSRLDVTRTYNHTLYMPCVGAKDRKSASYESDGFHNWVYEMVFPATPSFPTVAEWIEQHNEVKIESAVH